MLEFKYIYRTSGGERIESLLRAESRDAAFAALRERGIRPIKMIALTPETHEGVRGYGRRVLVITSLVVAVVAGIAGWVVANFGDDGQVAAEGHPGAVASVRKIGVRSGVVESSVIEARFGRRVAHSLARRQLPGPVSERDIVAAFSHGSERLLAHYACPGRVIGDAPKVSGLSEAEQLDFYEAMDELIYIDEGDSRISVMLKRIVVGMKEEVEVKLTGGTTVGEVLAWLSERQKMEASWRERIVSENTPEHAASLMKALGL